VNWVTSGDTVRFVNWIENGQPTGPQELSTTEDGSYLVNGATTQEERMAITRKPGAIWVLPDDDEWHKAAYHKNNVDTLRSVHRLFGPSTNDYPAVGFRLVRVPEPGTMPLLTLAAMVIESRRTK
jgi:hypothetical protein